MRYLFESYQDFINEKYKLGDGWNKSFDYEGMLKAGSKAKLSDGTKKLEKLASSYEDVNYHTEVGYLFSAIEYLKAGKTKDAKEEMKEFNRRSAETLKSIQEEVKNHNILE